MQFPILRSVKSSSLDLISWKTQMAGGDWELERNQQWVRFFSFFLPTFCHGYLMIILHGFLQGSSSAAFPLLFGWVFFPVMIAGLITGLRVCLSALVWSRISTSFLFVCSLHGAFEVRMGYVCWIHGLLLQVSSVFIRRCWWECQAAVCNS